MVGWCLVCGGQSTSDMSGTLLPPPLLNNILNFKVIFQPPLITSPSDQCRIGRNQCRVSLVFMIKMKSFIFASSQLSLPHIVFECLYVLLAKIQTSIWCSSLLVQNIEWWMVVVVVVDNLSSFVFPAALIKDPQISV